MPDEHTPNSKVRTRLNHLSQRATGAWSQAAEKGQSLYQGAAERAGDLCDQYQNSRAREYVEGVMNQAGQGLDTISGKAMYELVRDRLDLQDRYNDLLATKLQEALDRIEMLEKQTDRGNQECEP